jgi:hypothetical protein
MVWHICYNINAHKREDLVLELQGSENTETFCQTRLPIEAREKNDSGRPGVQLRFKSVANCKNRNRKGKSYFVHLNGYSKHAQSAS